MRNQGIGLNEPTYDGIIIPHKRVCEIPWGSRYLLETVQERIALGESPKVLASMLIHVASFRSISSPGKWRV